MKKNLKIIIWVLSIAGIILLMASAMMKDHQTKMLLFYITGGLLLAVLISYAIYAAKPRSFADKSKNPG